MIELQKKEVKKINNKLNTIFRAIFTAIPVEATCEWVMNAIKVQDYKAVIINLILGSLVTITINTIWEHTKDGN